MFRFLSIMLQRHKLAIRNLPPFSPVAIRLLQMLHQENISYKQVCDTLLTDAGFSAEILRLANSAAIGCRFPSTSILQAISVLGIPRVSALAVSLALSKFLKPISKLPIMRLCWRHNLATAFCASELADRYNLERDVAYTFGLLHDVGRLGLVVSAPKEYTQIVEIALTGQNSLVALERSTFGFDHREVGAWLTAQWHLPPDLAEVSLHHGPGAEPTTSLARLVHEACQNANRVGFAVCEPSRSNSASRLTDLAVAEQVNKHELEYGF